MVSIRYWVKGERLFRVAYGDKSEWIDGAWRSAYAVPSGSKSIGPARARELMAESIQPPATDDDGPRHVIIDEAPDSPWKIKAVEDAMTGTYGGWVTTFLVETDPPSPADLEDAPKPKKAAKKKKRKAAKKKKKRTRRKRSAD